MPLLLLGGQTSAGSGKTFSVAFTRMGIGGGISFPLDPTLFANKVAGPTGPVVPPLPAEEGKFGAGMGGFQRNKRRKELRAIIEDDEDIMNMVAQALPEMVSKYLN